MYTYKYCYKLTISVSSELDVLCQRCDIDYSAGDVESDISIASILLPVHRYHTVVVLSLVFGRRTHRPTLTSQLKSLYLISATQSERENTASSLRVVSKGTAKEQVILIEYCLNSL